MKINQEQIPTLPAETAEALPLAAEMAAAHRRMVEVYREHCKGTLQEALDRADEPLDLNREKRIRSCAPDRVSWFDLHQLAERDPNLPAQRWKEIKQLARTELRSGHNAAKVLETATATPWQPRSSWHCGTNWPSTGSRPMALNGH